MQHLRKPSHSRHSEPSTSAEVVSCHTMPAACYYCCTVLQTLSSSKKGQQALECLLNATLMPVSEHEWSRSCRAMAQSYDQPGL